MLSLYPKASIIYIVLYGILDNQFNKWLLDLVKEALPVQEESLYESVILPDFLTYWEQRHVKIHSPDWPLIQQLESKWAGLSKLDL
jgi:hypothetical protein